MFVKSMVFVCTILLFYEVLGQVGIGECAATSPNQNQNEIIQKFASDVCGTPSIRGDTSNLQLSANADAGLKGIIKKLANLKVTAAAKYSSAEYHGVMQKDLPEIIKNNTDCKKEVAMYLVDKLFAPKLPPPQGGTPQEIFIAGTVCDDDDKPVRHAVVDIPGRGKTITDDNGSFDFIISQSRKTNIYEGSVTRDGYRISHFAITGPITKETLRIKLTKKVFPVESFIRPPSQMFIGHYLGMPQLDIKLSFYNPTNQRIKISNIALILISPKQERIEIPMVGVYLPSGQYSSIPLTTMDLDRSIEWNHGYRFFRNSYAANSVLYMAQLEYPSTMPIPEPGRVIYSKEQALRFENLMNQEMIWSPGKWEMLLKARTDNRELRRSFFFELTADDVAKLKSVKSFYQTGHSTHPMTINAPDGSSNIPKMIEANYVE